jgi:hypothetical protein
MIWSTGVKPVGKGFRCGVARSMTAETLHQLAAFGFGFVGGLHRTLCFSREPLWRSISVPSFVAEDLARSWGYVRAFAILVELFGHC